MSIAYAKATRKKIEIELHSLLKCQKFSKLQQEAITIIKNSNNTDFLSKTFSLKLSFFNNLYRTFVVFDLRKI